MMALALCEDSIRLRSRRDAIIDSLGTLPDKIRAVRQASRHKSMCLTLLQNCYCQAVLVFHTSVRIACQAPKAVSGSAGAEAGCKDAGAGGAAEGRAELAGLWPRLQLRHGAGGCAQGRSWATCYPNRPPVTTTPGCPTLAMIYCASAAPLWIQVIHRASSRHVVVQPGKWVSIWRRSRRWR